MALLLNPTVGMVTLKNRLVVLLKPGFDAAVRSDDPRGLHVLHVDHSRQKADPTKGPHTALWLLKALSKDLGNYSGTLTLFEKVGDPRVLSPTIIRESAHFGVVDSPGNLPNDKAHLGVSINPSLNLQELALYLQDGIMQGGIALVHGELDPQQFSGPDMHRRFANAAMRIFQGAFDRIDCIASPLFDDTTDPSATLVLRKK